MHCKFFICSNVLSYIAELVKIYSWIQKNVHTPLFTINAWCNKNPSYVILPGFVVLLCAKELLP